MQRHFDEELQKLKNDILRMGAMAQEAIAKAVEALKERDTALAKEVLEGDARMDALELEIDEKCLNLIALHQPMAGDLRFITTAIKINGHVERIGDMAVNIAEKVLILNEEPQLKPYIDIPRMAEIARGMIKESLDAFVSENVDLANKVRREDEIVDNLNDQIFRELLTFMMEGPRNIHRAMIISQVSKNIERISDHAKGIADMVVYMITGKSVRHESFTEEETS